MPQPLLPLVIAVCLASACSRPAEPSAPTPPPAAPKPATPPPLDPDNIVSIAIGSKDHTTLVAALQAAEYVTSVANPGPFTVFAPTNAAFAKLPAGTVEGLLQPDKKADLREVLKYHVAPAVFDEKTLQAMDGKQLAMANGKKVAIRVVDGKLRINDANVAAAIRASNGIVYVVDGVLLPPGN